MRTVPLPIRLRSFVTQPTRKGTPTGHRPPLDKPSRWTLIFDCETTIDAAQALRFGAYQVRESGVLHEAGLFYAPDLPEADRQMLERYAADHGLTIVPLAIFVQQVFYRYGYDRRGSIIGFNLPFDLSRLAIGHGLARRSMYGGFSLKLSDDRHSPAVAVKSLSRRVALMRFMAPMGQRTGRSFRKRGITLGAHRGFFVDVNTLAWAVLSRGFSLARLADALETQTRKADGGEHGAALTPRYIGYALTDVQVTWECYLKLQDRLLTLNLPKLHPHRVYSEASLGKAYLKAMGVKAWREVQPDVPPQLIATILSTYFGGRSEVSIRRELRQVVLCDFLSMYPTVNALMRLWRFMTADGVTWCDAASEVRTLLNRVTITDLQRPETWSRLTTLVRVRPQGDLFPVRASYAHQSPTIGLNHLSSDEPLWFTLADCIASKLLTGRTPDVVEALTFAPKDQQAGLRPIDIGGSVIDPSKDDLFKRLIEERQELKHRMTGASEDERGKLGLRQNALKLAANATSYGITVEMNVAQKSKKEAVTVHRADKGPFEVLTTKVEEPGRYFHPLLATLITGAARLMLTIAERLVIDRGLAWTFCDTDSLAIACPLELDRATFLDRVSDVVSWFEPLNPYVFGGSILQVEKVNLDPGSSEDHSLWCWAVSAKRYALFNLDASGAPVIRKASAHGLGHLLASYGTDDPAPGIPDPKHSLSEIGVERWQHDLWWVIVSSALRGEPDTICFDHHPALRQAAVSRYSATTPELLDYFRHYNASRSYREQVRPFGFMLSLHAARLTGATTPISPAATFDRDLGRAVASAFDRNTGRPVRPNELQTYAEALAQYHLKSEDKFDNGAFRDRGPTKRRHVWVSAIEWIGKEAHAWEEAMLIGRVLSELSYGFEPSRKNGMAEAITRVIQRHGQRALSRASGVSRTRIAALLQGKTRLRKRTLDRLLRAAQQLA